MTKGNKAAAAKAPGRGVHVSIAAMAGEVSSTRETITKRVADANVKPSGERNGKPLYRLKELLFALYQAGLDGKLDPEKLPAFERHAHYKAEREKIEFERELGQLIPAAEVERANSHIFKCVARVFDTLPDTLERDCGLNPQTLAVVERHLDAARLELHTEVNRGLDDSDTAGNGGDSNSEHVGDIEASASSEAERGGQPLP